MEKYCTATRDIDDNTIRRMRCACWITKAADTHSECVILIAFPRQQWLRERATMFYAYVACPAKLMNKKLLGLAEYCTPTNALIVYHILV